MKCEEQLRVFSGGLFIYINISAVVHCPNTPAQALITFGRLVFAGEIAQFIFEKKLLDAQAKKAKYKFRQMQLSFFPRAKSECPTEYVIIEVP